MGRSEHQPNLSHQLEKLSSIADWFSKREEIDVEKGLHKAKVAAKLIKSCKKRLGEIENEFEEIKMEISEQLEEEQGSKDEPSPESEQELFCQ